MASALPPPELQKQEGLGSSTSPPGMPSSAVASLGGGSPQKVVPQQGQSFEPMDKSSSQTVKLNPKMELGKNDLLKLLSYMEAELQARDVVIGTLKAERVKNLLHYGRTGLSDPFLALQRDGIGGSVVSEGGVGEGELRGLEESQLGQLENLILQQRKAHQRMRYVLREAEKRHAKTVSELEEERQKHEHDTAQGDDVTYALEKDRSRLKQEVESEKNNRKKAEKDLKKVQEGVEEEGEKQKQIILMLVEERKRLAIQYVEERKRSEDLAQILSEEKGRIDTMAEGLEEESKKSLQMEAELERQLADFDTERQHLRTQLTRKDDRICELEAHQEKLQKEVDYYKKQLQEAHNVAMFQQTHSISPPRLGVGSGGGSPRCLPPQLPAKPTALGQPATQSRMPNVSPRVRASSPNLDDLGSLHMSLALGGGGTLHNTGGVGGPLVSPGVSASSSITKAIQPTATVNSVPVGGATSGIARGFYPSVSTRQPMYCDARTLPANGKAYGEMDSSWAPLVDSDAASVERGLVRVTGGSDVSRCQPAQLVQVTPRVNVSASPGTKVVTTTHGGKVTFHVTTNSVSNNPTAVQSISKKQSSQALPPPPLPVNKPQPPMVPPNKPVVPPKKDLKDLVGRTGTKDLDSSSPISVEVKPQRSGPSPTTVKFGITISKGAGNGGVGVSGGSSSGGALVRVGSGGGGSGGSGSSEVPCLEGGGRAVSPRLDTAQVQVGVSPCDSVPEPWLHACVDSLSPELEHFHQLLISMAGSPNIVSSNLSHPVISYSEPLSSTIASPSSFLPESCFLPSTLLRNAPSPSPPPLPTSSPPLELLTCQHSSSTLETLQSDPPSNCEPQSPPDSPIDVTTPLTIDNLTALHLAAQGNNWQSVPVLVRCGASVTAEDSEGRTPLHLALLFAQSAAASALLAYAHSMEHTTKNGCNYLHAAVTSGSCDCLQLVVTHIFSSSHECQEGMALLHWLVTSANHEGQTPLSLALYSGHMQMVTSLADAGIDVASLASRFSSVAALVPSVVSSERNELTCCVRLVGISPLEDECANVSYNVQWVIGSTRVSPATLWATLEGSLVTLLLRHWQALQRLHNLNKCVDTNFLGLQATAVSHFSIGHHTWSKGEYGLVSGPYDLLMTGTQNTCQDICIHLHLLESMAYSILVPVPLMKDYLRLMEQSRCVVIYGPEGSGKRTLALSLALLSARGKESCRGRVTRMKLTTEVLTSAVVEADDTVVVLERLPRDDWPHLWSLLSGTDGLTVVTMDACRRPGGGSLEGGVVWLQLRHDREPLVRYVAAALSRQLWQVGMGQLPPFNSEMWGAVQWAELVWGRLTATLMSLGFASAVRGPALFARRLLKGSNNPRDLRCGVIELWNAVFAPAVQKEVSSVWRQSAAGGAQGDMTCHGGVEEARVVEVALHVVVTRSLEPGVPKGVGDYLATLKGRPPQTVARPTHLNLKTNLMSELPEVLLTSPLASPDWDETHLARLLGLAPQGYS